MKRSVLLVASIVILMPALFGRADGVSTFVNCAIILSLDSNHEIETKPLSLEELTVLAKRKSHDIKLMLGGRKEYATIHDRTKKTHSHFRLERIGATTQAIPFESEFAFDQWLREGKINLAEISSKPTVGFKLRRFFHVGPLPAEPLTIDGVQIESFRSRINQTSQFWFDYFLDSVSLDTLAATSFLLSQGRASRLAINISWALADTQHTDLFTTELAKNIWAIATELGYKPRLTQTQYRYFELDGIVRGVSSIHSLQNGETIAVISPHSPSLHFKITPNGGSKRSQIVELISGDELKEFSATILPN